MSFGWGHSHYTIIKNLEAIASRQVQFISTAFPRKPQGHRPYGSLTDDFSQQGFLVERVGSGSHMYHPTQLLSLGLFLWVLCETQRPDSSSAHVLFECPDRKSTRLNSS